MSICHNFLTVLPIALVFQLAKENGDDDENRDAIADALSEVMYDVFTQESNGERVVKILATDANELVSGIMNLNQACLSRCSVLLTEIETGAVDEDEIALDTFGRFSWLSAKIVGRTVCANVWRPNCWHFGKTVDFFRNSRYKGSCSICLFI
jgi:hypothetical protein